MRDQISRVEKCRTENAGLEIGGLGLVYITGLHCHTRKGIRKIQLLLLTYYFSNVLQMKSLDIPVC